MKPSGKLVEFVIGLEGDNEITAAGMHAVDVIEFTELGPIMARTQVRLRNPDQYGKPNQHRLWYNSAVGRWTR